MEEDQYSAEGGEYLSGSYNSSPENYAIGNYNNSQEQLPNQDYAMMGAGSIDPMNYATPESYSQEDMEDDQFLGFSESKPKEGLYALFNKVLTLPNSVKVGNVDKYELGDMGLSVREGLRIALLGETFGHPMFAKFFLNQANIITDTSMAKKGWFTELFVTAKRFTEKSMGAGSGSNPSSQANLPETSRGKVSSFFSGKKS